MPQHRSSATCGDNDNTSNIDCHCAVPPHKSIRLDAQTTVTTNSNVGCIDSDSSGNKDQSAASKGHEAVCDSPLLLPLSFRHDVCEEKTTQLYCKDQLRVRARFHLAQWQRTVASKKDHEIFLKMLVVEAHRQNSMNVNAHRMNVLIAAIDDAFHSKSNTADPYLSTLQLISSGRLFEQPQQHQQDVATCENSLSDFMNEYSML
jgi:hypothetical protein